jgi:hypothetical protein
MWFHGSVPAQQPDMPPAKPTNWNAVDATFRNDDRGREFVKFLEKTHCEVPLKAKLQVANMQRAIHGYIQNRFELQDGSYGDFRRLAGRQNVWPNRSAPKPVKIDTSEEKVLRLMHRHVDSLKLPEHTIEWFTRIYRGMMQHSLRVLDIAHVFPDASTLFSEATKEEPVGKIDALYGPHSILFRCDDPLDFQKLYVPIGGTPETTEGYTDSLGYMGCSTFRVINHANEKNIEEIPATRVIAVNTSKQPTEKDHVLTFDHEVEHAINAFYRHSSTYNAPPSPQWTAFERCIYAGLEGDLKEEIIPWSIETDDFHEIFLNHTAAYDFVKFRKKRLNELKVPEQDIDAFGTEATLSMRKILPVAEKAVDDLYYGQGSTLARELMRSTPLAQWPDLADVYGK